MSTQTATPTVSDDEATPAPAEGSSAHAAIEAEMLIEEISIDGMCGVY